MNSQFVKSKRIISSVALMVLLALAGCDAPDPEESVNVNELELPTDYDIAFFCEDEGVYPDRCVLDNPDNPYANANINEVTKWELHDDAPSAKARFYLWATAYTRIPAGENQYYVARSLHSIYTVNQDEVTKEQVIKAYRSVLDNFYGHVTYFEATWSGPDIYYANDLASLVGGVLHNPTAESLSVLFADEWVMQATLTEWGYLYNTGTGVMSKIE